MNIPASYLIKITLLFISPVWMMAQSSVLTFGNLADADATFFQRLQQQLKDKHTETAVVISGDLIDGCLPGGEDFDPTPLDQFFKIVQQYPAVPFYLIPGDRDWNYSKADGWECVRRLDDYLEKQKLPNLHWELDKGCPGPKVIKLSNSTVLILINTQWWNHPYQKPTPADALCKFSEPEIILEEIHDAIEENLNKNVLIAGHFPPQSQSRYGGEFPLADHIKPPLIGSIKVAYRQSVGKAYDIQNAVFNPFRRQLLDLTYEYKGLLFLCSHDPNHQVLNLQDNYMINSGAPVKGRWAAKHKPALFASSAAGLAQLDFQTDGRVDYHFIPTLEDTNPEQRTLYAAPCKSKTESPSLINPTFSPCIENIDALPNIDQELPARVSTVGGTRYKASGFKEIFFGPHYRSSWIKPIEVDVLNIDDPQLPLTPTKIGGGRQTKSLKFKAADGQNWVFRSVDKDPAGTLSIALRNSLIAEATRDQTSSQHPYGAMAVSSLLDQIDILHARPRLYVLGNHSKLGPFQENFANMLGMLEERPSKGPKGQKGSFGADDILKSHELFKLRYDDQDVQINYREFVRARLFDILIGDWSKHEDNWKWALYKEQGNLIIRPIPRDRDHAFSNLDGLFPWLASRRWAVPNLEHFDYEIEDVRSLTFQARHMDRLFLNSVDKKVFLEEANYLKNNISDADIETAIQTMPSEIIPISGEEIKRKLQRRLKDMEAYAEEYYKIHARFVDVVGTNKAEVFSINHQADGNTLIKVVDPKGDQAGRVLYERLFQPGETKEIRLYGLGDDDQFQLAGTPSQKVIPIRIIGGAGNDEILDQTQVLGKKKHTFVYEQDAGANLKLGSRAKLVEDWRPELYRYDRRAFEYNRYFPIAYLGFNSFNGVQFGGGVSFTRRSFTRREYSSKHSFRGSISTLANFTLKYNADWAQRIHKWDVLAEVAVERPSFYNFFFGVGNDTQKDPVAFNDNFNLVRLQHARAEVGLRRFFRRRSHFQVMMGFEDNNTVETENTILAENPDLKGVGSLSWFYLRPQISLDLRDHQIFPRRGFRIMAQQEWGLGDIDFGVSKVSTEYYFTPRRFPVTFGARIGYANSQGDAPFYKLPSLGLNEGLRGFQRNRFVGESYLYYNTEIRVPVALWKSSIIPMIVGVRAFVDSGSILNDPNSDQYHTSYGGGVFLIPLTRSYTVSLLLGFSEEETALLSLNLGTNF